MKTVRTVIINDISVTNVDIGRFHKKRGGLDEESARLQENTNWNDLGRAWKSGTFAGLENRTVSEAQSVREGTGKSFE